MPSVRWAIAAGASTFGAGLGWFLGHVAYVSGTPNTVPKRYYGLRTKRGGAGIAHFRGHVHRNTHRLPEHVRPIVVTDAGFRGPWFRAVEAIGWHWLAQLRNTTYIKPSNPPSEPRQWVLCKAMYA